MKAWIIYSKQDAVHNKNYIDLYMEEGKQLAINFFLIYAEELEFGVKDGTWFLSYQEHQIEKPQFAICRTIYPLLSKQLECMGIKVFNNSKVAKICNDKARTYQYIAKTSIPIIDSIFCKNQHLKQKMELITCPTVIKSVGGHGGSQVFLLEHTGEQSQIAKIFEAMNGQDAVLQPLIGTRHQDLRVYMIDNQVIAAVLRTAKEGFKSNFSLGGSVELYHLSQDENKIIQKISSLFEFGMVGIDFVIGDNGELLFNEIEDVVGARMLYQCSNVNIVKLYLDYIIEHL